MAISPSRLLLGSLKFITLTNPHLLSNDIVTL